MRSRWLAPCFLLLVATPIVRGQAIRTTDSRVPFMTVGHIVTSAATETPAPAPVPYAPQPGDIILYDDHNKLFHFVFKLANTAPPTHAAMVIAGADGKPALLELTGPKVITARVKIMDVDERFRSYPGMVMVRKIRQPLTPEQSRDLTHFAEAQVGKLFAAGRVALQITPFCPRSGLRKELFGHTYLNRNRWFCSEIVVAACCTARIMDGRRCDANATYPRDLAYDERLDLSGLYHPPALWLPDAPLVQQVQGVR